MGKIPFIYECAARAVNELNTKKGSLRQIMEQFNAEPKSAKAIYALTTKVVKNIQVIKKVIKATDLLSKVQCDSALLEVLVAELLFGEHLYNKQRNNIIANFLSHRKIVKEEFKNLSGGSDKSNKVSNLPVKYLRINLLKCSMDEMVQMLESKGYSQIVLQECNSFESFLQSAGEIKEKTFIKDFHFPEELLVVNVNNKSDIMKMDDYKNGKIIFFDKASLLAVEMLQIKKGMTVLDICAAPGMKTAAIASRCDNDLKIVSFDRDSKRCKEMKNLMSTLGVKCVDIHCSDFLGNDEIPEGKIDAILLDPSCSGSGMVDRLDYSKNDDQHRCFKLASFQTKMLCKAMSLRPKRIVYSTCSLSETENEFVIRSALKEAENGGEYEMVKVLPTWPMRGEKGAKQCIRSDGSCLTKGFFAAALRRKK